MTVEVVYFVARGVLAAVCVWAAVAKARDLRGFAAGLYGYGFIPAGLARPAAVAVIGVELLLGAALIGNLWPVFASAAALALFVSFTTLMAIRLYRGTAGPCHCFGSDPLEQISVFSLVRSVILASISGACLVFAFGDPELPARSEILPALTFIAGLAVSTRLISYVPQTIAAFAQPARAYPTPTSRVSFRHERLEHIEGFASNGRHSASADRITREKGGLL